MAPLPTAPVTARVSASEGFDEAHYDTDDSTPSLPVLRPQVSVLDDLPKGFYVDANFIATLDANDLDVLVELAIHEQLTTDWDALHAAKRRLTTTDATTTADTPTAVNFALISEGENGWQEVEADRQRIQAAADEAARAEREAAEKAERKQKRNERLTAATVSLYSIAGAIIICVGALLYIFASTASEPAEDVSPLEVAHSTAESAVERAEQMLEAPHVSDVRIRLDDLPDVEVESNS